MVNKRIRKVGDVFYIPLDENRGALGQVVAVPTGDLVRSVAPFVVVYEGLYQQSEIVVEELSEIVKNGKAILLMSTPLHNPTDKRWKFLARIELPENVPFQVYSYWSEGKKFLTTWDFSEEYEAPLTEESKYPSFGVLFTNNIINECAKAKHGMKTEWDVSEEYLWQVTPRNDNLASEFFNTSESDI